MTNGLKGFQHRKIKILENQFLVSAYTPRGLTPQISSKYISCGFWDIMMKSIMWSDSESVSEWYFVFDKYIFNEIKVTYFPIC